MTTDALSPDETRCLIDYAKRKFAEERWPLSAELRPVREAMAKLEPRAAEPPRPSKPYVPSMVMQKARNRRR